MADTTLSAVVGGNRPPVSINGRTVTVTGQVGSATVAQMNAAGAPGLSGALTANTWKTVVNLTGIGIAKLANVWQVDTTARSLGIQVTLDGTVVYTNFVAATATNGHGLNAIGATTGNPGSIVFERVPFSASLKIEIKSSLTETDKLAYLAIYDLT